MLVVAVQPAPNLFEYIFEEAGNGAQGGPCNKPCSGLDPNDDIFCGGLYMASVYEKENSGFVIPALVPSVGLWNGLGCYKSAIFHLSQW